METVALFVGEDSKRVRERLATAITVTTMLSLGKDGILQRFFDHKNAVSRSREFREYLKTAAGADHVRITLGTDYMSAAKLANLKDEDPTFVREVSLWDAVHRFREYITGTVEVGHALVMPFLQLLDKKMLVTVLEHVSDEDVIHMPLGGIQASRVAYVGIVIKHPDGTYEGVTLRSAMNTRKNLGHLIPSLHPVASKIVSLQVRRREVSSVVHKLEHEVQPEMIIAHVVSSTDFACLGLVLKGGLFVPSARPDRDAIPHVNRIVYYDDLWKSPVDRSVWSVKRATEFLKKITTVEPVAVRGSTDVVVALKVRDLYVPLHGSAAELRVLMRDSQDDLVAFLKISNDEMLSKRVTIKESLLKTYDAMIGNLRQKHVSEMAVLCHPLCPYSEEQRVEALLELSSPLLTGIRDDVARHVCMRIIQRQTMSRDTLSEDDAAMPNVIVATEDDVIDGSLLAMVATATQDLAYFNTLRRVLTTTTVADDKLQAAFDVPVPSPTALRPYGKGLNFFETRQTGPDVIYSLAAVVRELSGSSPALTVSQYVSTFVDWILDRIEKYGGSFLNTDRSLDPVVTKAILAELSVKHSGVRKRLVSRLIPVFRVAQGDVARYLSRSDTIAVVYGTLGPPVVQGSGDKAVVAFIRRGGLAMALKTGTGGSSSTAVFKVSELPRGVRAVVNNRVDTSVTLQSGT